MSKAFAHINIPRIARAVSNTLENQRKHKVNAEKEKAAKEFATMKPTTVRIDSRNVTEEQAQRVALEIMPAAEKLLLASPALAERGYLITHRSIGHLLPVEYKWTVVGAVVINSILERVRTTKEYMPSWEQDIAAHLSDVRRGEDEKRQHRDHYDQENLAYYGYIGQELERLIAMNDRRIGNYLNLFNYLRTGLPRYFRGARGVDLIHGVMKANLKHASLWEKEMDIDHAEAVRRDAEYKQAKAAQHGQPRMRGDYSQVNGHGPILADMLFEIDPAGVIPGQIMPGEDSSAQALEDGYSALDANELT